MPIAFDAVTVAGSSNTGTSWSALSHTAAGSDRAVFVCVSCSSQSDVTSVTYGGVSMTKVDSIKNIDFNGHHAAMWKLSAPATGSQAVVIGFSAAVAATAAAISFTGCHQTTSSLTGTPAKAAGSSTSPSISVSSASGEVVLDVLSFIDRTATGGAGQDVLWNSAGVPADGRPGGAGSTEAGASSVTMSWSLNTSGHWAMVGVSIKPAPDELVMSSMRAGDLPYLPSKREKRLSTRRGRSDPWLDLTVSNWQDQVFEQEPHGSNIRFFGRPPAARRLPDGFFIHISDWQVPENLEQISALGVNSFFLPELGKPPLPKGWMGWYNKDNEIAFARMSFDIPVLRKENLDYILPQIREGEPPNPEFQPANSVFVVPPGSIRFELGSDSLPVGADSLQAHQSAHFDVPLSRDRHTYTGWQLDVPGADINEWLEKQFALPQLGRDRHQYGGLQAFDVVDRDETGDLVAYRGSVEYTTIPPWARNRHTYDGWFIQAIFIERLEDPAAGFTFADLPPIGGDMLDYGGWSHRSDLEQLRQDPVAGFTFMALPPAGLNTFFSIHDYAGGSAMPRPPDFIPPVSRIWRPVIRPRRR